MKPLKLPWIRHWNDTSASEFESIITGAFLCLHLYNASSSAAMIATSVRAAQRYLSIQQEVQDHTLNNKLIYAYFDVVSILCKAVIGFLLSTVLSEMLKLYIAGVKDYTLKTGPIRTQDDIAFVNFNYLYTEHPIQLYSARSISTLN